VAGGEVNRGRTHRRGERTVVDAQGERALAQDVEHVEHVVDAPGAAYEPEHLGEASARRDHRTFGVRMFREWGLEAVLAGDPIPRRSHPAQ
jgi:hypothetical protein